MTVPDRGDRRGVVRAGLQLVTVEGASRRPGLFRSGHADRVQIDRRTRPFRSDHRGDRRRRVPAGPQIVAVVDDERLAVEGEIGARQLAEGRAFGVCAAP